MSFEVKILTGQIHLLTGLHIGAGNDDIHIGGIDNPVVKDMDGMPYIPGSSLKGKIRCLLEIAEGAYSDNGNKPSNSITNPDSLIPKMFGDTVKYQSRVLFRDCFLSDRSKEELKNKSISATEAKVENSINRWKGQSMQGGLRTTERAIAGLYFDYEIVVRLFDGDDEKAIKDKLVLGMKMLENDALGGSGSRGYGQIKFVDSKWDGEDLAL